MPRTPHREKLIAAIANPKCADDLPLLRKAQQAYEQWVRDMDAVTTTDKKKVEDLTALLNRYKDFLEVDLIAERGSPFLKRQKGQLKLDNSVMEEFLVRLVDPAILPALPAFDLEVGPQKAFMSLSFLPASIASLDEKPDVILKVKDQDFAIGKSLHFKFSPTPTFEERKTTEGRLYLAVVAAECKINYDKTMFQECAGTASRLKQGCPLARYYALVEYLDMEPEDCRLTDIDNVYLLRHAKRLPFEKRSVLEEVRAQHQNCPIDSEVVWRFTEEIQNFIAAVWFDPEEALRRGSFL